LTSIVLTPTIDVVDISAHCPKYRTSGLLDLDSDWR